MRARHLGIILLFALLHFGLLGLVIWKGLIIFRGPSTPSEIFWDRAMHVLFFPGSLFIRLVSDKTCEIVLTGLNSLLWGAVMGSVYIMLRKPKSS